MDFTTALLSILTIHLMASISPGPDFVVVSQKTLLQGRRAGIICGAGVCAGLLVHIFYSVAGLSVAFESSQIIKPLIGGIGGCYLVYLGSTSIKGSFSNSKTASNETGKKIDTSSPFWSGLIVNVFNPKAAIYFISLFSIIISPSLSSEKLALVIILILLVQMSWYLTFIYIVTIPSIRVKFDKTVHIIDRLLGLFMIIMGLYMIATSLLL